MNYLLLKPIDTTSLLWVILIVAVLAIVFAVLIVLVSKLCFVNKVILPKTVERPINIVRTLIE